MSEHDEEHFQNGSTSGKNIKSNKMHDTRKDSETSLDLFDIVGDTCDARFPWQRDVSTQCSIPVKVTPVDLSHGVPTHLISVPNSLRTLSVPGSRPLERPHSIGCLEGTVLEDELDRLRQGQLRVSRKSDSFLQISPRLHRKRLSLAVSDDHGSPSDLGSISELPDFER